MSKRKTAEDNISVAVAVLQTTRAALFFGAKSLEGERRSNGRFATRSRSRAMDHDARLDEARRREER